MPKPVPVPKNKSKVKAKESAARQPTLFSHFKSKERALSIENDESTKGQTPASQGVTSDAQKTVIDALQPPSTGVGELSQSEPTDGGPLVISTPTSEVLAFPPSSPLSVAPSPTATLSSPDIEIVAVDPPPLLPLPKTLHPFFSRPSKSKQSSPEIIIVAESSPPPEVVKDAKTTNDSSQKKTLGPPRARGLRRGHSYECPIVVDSSPVKPTPSSQPSLRVSQKPNHSLPKQIHPLFQLRATRARSGSPLVLDRATPLLAPFPDSESQHVKGPQQDITVAKHSLSFDSKKSIDEIDGDPLEQTKC
ncbi:hypothetical protein ONZ45_g19136 [Pleurotus djamor]|nr:hypothetical protein ONZ45_g19136 [Pleurotus djamor]